MISALVSVLLCLWFFISVVFRGFRIGGIFTTVMLLCAAFLVTVFLCCRFLFTPSRKDRQAADVLLSGLREKDRHDPD